MTTDRPCDKKLVTFSLIENFAFCLYEFESVQERKQASKEPCVALVEHTECKRLPPDHLAMISVRQATWLVAMCQATSRAHPAAPSVLHNQTRQHKILASPHHMKQYQSYK